MSGAADAEDKTDKHPVTPGVPTPARELYGLMLLEHARKDDTRRSLEAEQVFPKHSAKCSRPIYDRLDETLGITVTSLFPHFVDAQQSAMRGLHIGWYAIDQDGEIASGPYRGRNECVISIGQSPNGAPALWSRP
jgi:hypothetical protein